MPTRREALASLGGLAAASALFPGLSLAAVPTDRRLVVLILRGGMDGLGAVVPHADRHHDVLRPNLRLSPPGSPDGVVDLDGRFGLHPALAPLHPLYARGEMAVVHAVGTPDRTRSHFDAQDTLENGTSRARGAPDGWLNRAVGTLAGDGLGIAVGPTTPLVMRGSTRVRSWAPSAIPAAGADLMTRVGRLYRDDPLFAATFARARQSAGMTANAMPGRRPPKGGIKAFHQMAEAAGKFLALADGPRIASLEFGGWDTHAGQKFRLNRQLGALAGGIDLLRMQLGPAWNKTVVLAVSEFGRTARENGSRGTDHGTGGVVLLAGGAVRGGRVRGRWPGLSPDALYQGRDLAATTDLRAVLKGVLEDHLGIARAALDGQVFPGSPHVSPMGGLVRKG